MILGQPIFEIKLGKNENIILENDLWKMLFATRYIEEVEEFW